MPSGRELDRHVADFIASLRGVELPHSLANTLRDAIDLSDRHPDTEGDS